MRVPYRRWQWLAAFSLLCAGLSVAPARAADDASLKGNWKLLMISVGETELLVFDVKEDDGKLTAKVLDTPPFLRGATIDSIARKGEKVSLGLTLGGGPATFTGTPDKEGKALGTLRVQGQLIPARLEKTEDQKLGAGTNNREFQMQLQAVLGEGDVKEQAKKCAALIEKAPGNPKMTFVYNQLFKDAGAAGLTEKELRHYYDEWVNGAKAYGSDYADTVRLMALNALSGQKEAAGLTLELATEIDKNLGPDAPIETRAAVVKALASAAKLAGKTEIAEAAVARSEKFETELDEEYHKKVPPFKPEVSEAPKDRVVLLELFTGAECPPCVAADVAFDALLQTYKPAQVVALQYHLHIPGPDPLANPDSIERASYYPSLRGTPSTFFNGVSLSGGGGPMDNSKNKYDDYRQIIDKGYGEKSPLPGRVPAADKEKNPHDDNQLSLFSRTNSATIDLQVDRSGDEVKIVASAQVKSKGDDKDQAKEGADKSNPRLRLALIEEQVRYVGGNKLRFHHHVVRAMPGGVAGKALTDGQGKTEVTLKLSEVKKGLEDYIAKHAKEPRGEFSHSLPPINLDGLSVVAFVQDDSDQKVLNAVLSPVGAAK